MAGPLGKTELDAMGCGTPGCQEDHSSLYLHSECHPGAAMWGRYDKKIGALVLECEACGLIAGGVWVGEKPEGRPN
jgi:hypothetical protein